MPVNILMPALSPTMEKGNLSKWLKREGDKVKAGDVIAEIETDKATMEYESIDDGVLAKIMVPEGTADVAVNQLIAEITNSAAEQSSGIGQINDAVTEMDRVTQSNASLVEQNAAAAPGSSHASPIIRPAAHGCGLASPGASMGRAISIIAGSP